MRSSVLRFAQRLFLWLGVAALAYAGGTAAYAGMYQRYESWTFEQAVATPKVITTAIVEAPPDLREAGSV